MSTRLVAIHQPNFFPWLGYFDKITRADVFVVLDHVQFPKSEGNWSNRVRLAVNGEPAWVTMPVARNYDGFRRIDEMRIDNGAPWRRKLMQLVRTNYGKAAAFKDVLVDLESWIQNPTDSVADYNLAAIMAICERLGITSAQIVRSSGLAVTGTKTDLLVNIVKATGGTMYLSGDGSDDYLDDAVFAEAGIGLTYQRFVHPVYRQGSMPTFLSGLSILDALFHCGFDGTSKMLQTARRIEPGLRP
jgi:hypothetical protein